MAFRSDPRQGAALAFLTAIGVCANILELFFPAPPLLPWLKPGLANAFTMAAIALYGPVAGLSVALLRTLIAAFLSGLPVTSLLIGGASGIISSLVMGIAWVATGRGRFLSLYGMGMVGAFTHTLVQLGIVYLLFVRNAWIFWQIPAMGPASILTGLLTGAIAVLTVRFITRADFIPKPAPEPLPARPARPALVRLTALVLASLLIFRLSGLVAQALVLFMVALPIWGRRNPGPLLLRFLPLLLLTLILNAFTEPGHYFQGIPFVTREGIEKGLFLNLRLANLIGLSLILVSKDDLSALFSVLMRFHPAFAAFGELGIRSLGGIPAAAGVFGKVYASGKGLGPVKRWRHLTGSLPGAMREVLERI